MLCNKHYKTAFNGRELSNAEKQSKGKTGTKNVLMVLFDFFPYCNFSISVAFHCLYMRLCGNCVQVRELETFHYLEKWLKYWGGVNLGHPMDRWSESFVNRHQFVFIEICGAAGDTCEETVVECFFFILYYDQKMHKLFHKLSSSYIFLSLYRASL